MTVRSIRSSAQRKVSPEEWQARVELAACHRLLAHFGVQDLTYNHLSVRVPGEPDKLLIKSGTMMFDEITASNLLKFDFDGNPMQDSPPLRGGALVIHAGILKARPDLHAVFHTHTAANIGVSAQKNGLLMISERAVKFHNRVAYHTFGGFEFELAQREPLIRALGDKRIAMLRNHGALVCGRSLSEAFVDHHFLELACRGQVAALSGGVEITIIPDEIAERCANLLDFADPAQTGSKDWEASLRLAYRLDPGFAE